MANDFIPASELIINGDGSIYHLHLKSDEIADTIITVGDPERVEQVARHFDTIELKRSNREFTTITGVKSGKRLSVISTGIGTDNVDIVLNEIDALFQFDFTTRKQKEKHTQLTLVRIGTSGALQEDIALDSFLVSEKALAFDRLLGFYDTRNFERLKHWPERLADVNPYITKASTSLLHDVPEGILRGITATMPGFYAPQGRNFRLYSIFSNNLEEVRTLKINGKRVTNLEMETAGIYGLSTLLGHRAISFNALLANRVTGEFSKRAKQTVEQLIEQVLAWLTALD
jgi:uridine phosphorylase